MPVQQLVHCSLEPTPPKSSCREQECSGWCCQHCGCSSLQEQHSSPTVLPAPSNTHHSRGKVSRGKSGRTAWYIQVSAPVDKLWEGKALLIRTGHKEIGTETHHTDKPWRGSRQNLLPCGHKILPTTLYNMGLNAMPISRAEFTAVLVPFPPFCWHHSGCFLLLIWHFHLFFCKLVKLFSYSS